MMVAVVLIAVSCSPYRKMRNIRSGTVALSLSVPEEPPVEEEEDMEVSVDSIRGTLVDEPLIMNAIRDSETGEMVATDVISASKVTARFRNVAERAENEFGKDSEGGLNAYTIAFAMMVGVLFVIKAITKKKA